MKEHEIQPEALEQHTVLQERLRAASITLIACAEDGKILAPSRQADDWFARLLGAAPIFRTAVKRACTQWRQEHEAIELEAFPGLWLVPLPLTNRRRRVGYSIAVIPTEKLRDAEQLAAMCQSARMDLALCRQMLKQMPPASSQDVGRLASLVKWAHDDHTRLTSSTQAVESVGKQLAESYEEMNLLYTIIQSMTVQERPERFVAIACQELLATLPFAWIGTQFGEDRNRLKSLAGRMIIAGNANQPAASIRDAARNLLAEAQPNVPMVLEPASNPRHAAFALMGPTILVQPVSSDGEVIGLLIAGDKQGPDTAASSVDMKLLGATATHMGIFLENAALYDDLNAMFLGTLEALTASIDAKDRYTCGHSRRVAHLTQQLAQAIGLDEATVGRMRIAGLVHDVGKIGVPETVLLKPGKLTPDEFGWIRKHPEIGYRILRDIPQLNDILPGVLHHHERWDGRGYPDGLHGEGIPLVARLIALADSFDAMSSTRTYRSALSRAQVLDEIIQCSGTQFDPALAAVFVKMDFGAFDELVRAHQAREQEQMQQEEAA